MVFSQTGNLPTDKAHASCLCDSGLLCGSYTQDGEHALREHLLRLWYQIGKKSTVHYWMFCQYPCEQNSIDKQFLVVKLNYIECCL